MYDILSKLKIYNIMAHIINVTITFYYNTNQNKLGY